MEPDFSILRKTGHFYFALTRRGTACGQVPINAVSTVDMKSGASTKPPFCSSSALTDIFREGFPVGWRSFRSISTA